MVSVGVFVPPVGLRPRVNRAPHVSESPHRVFLVFTFLFPEIKCPHSELLDLEFLEKTYNVTDGGNLETST